eukprot:gb/GECG01003040.1/.p1 GENE.gb/GECG01003040.1/~~gb/GECG01003040.1/.p1  ORF type:complete len:665 (+),score=113.53 gb/GECG01003040.1/:1-1995(+)
MGQMTLDKEQNNPSHEEHPPHTSCVPSLKLDLSEINLSEAAKFIRNHLCSSQCVENLHWIVEGDAPKSVKRDARFLVRRRRKRLKDAAVTIQRHVKGFLLRKGYEFSKWKSGARLIENELWNWRRRRRRNATVTDNPAPGKTSLKEGCAIMIQQWWQQEKTDELPSNEAGKYSGSETEAENGALFQTVSAPYGSRTGTNGKPTREKMELESVHSPRSSDPSTAMEHSPMAQSSMRSDLPSEQSERKWSEESNRSLGFTNINDVFASRAAAAKQALMSTSNENEQIRERQKKVEMMEKQRLEAVRRKVKQEAGKRAKEAIVERQRGLFQDLMKELRRWHQSQREKKHAKARRKRAEKIRASKQRHEESEEHDGPKDKAQLREEMQALVRNARVALRNRLQQSAASQDGSQTGSRGSSPGEDSRSAKDHMRIAAARQANQQPISSSKKSRKRRRGPKNANDDISVEQELGLSSQEPSHLRSMDDKQPRIAPATPIRVRTPAWNQVRSYFGFGQAEEEDSNDSDSGFDVTATVQITQGTQQDSEHEINDSELKDSVSHGKGNNSNVGNAAARRFNPIMTETPVELEHLNYKIDQTTSISSYHNHSNPGAAIREELARHHSKTHYRRQHRSRRGASSSSSSQPPSSPFISYDGHPVSSVEELLQHYRR